MAISREEQLRNNRRFSRQIVGAVAIVLIIIGLFTVLSWVVGVLRSSSGSTAGTSWYGGHDYSNVYDYSYYRSQNADLRAAFGNDANAYLQHFVNYGMAEGRQGRASFNVYTYRDEHPELWEKFGDNLRGYYLWACGIPQ